MNESQKSRMNDTIRAVIKERTGPSFEERVAASAANFRKVAKATEEMQNKKIEEALARAKAHPCESPARSKDLTPPTVEEMGKMHALTRRQNEKEYARLHAERQHRMNTREPLFKLEEVAAAFDMQAQRMKDNKKRMQADEDARWAHIKELEMNVINRPLLLENPETAKPPPEEEKKEEDANDPNWKKKFQKKMNGRIRETIKERSGPSFEERCAARAKKFRQEALATQITQQKKIDEALARAKQHPMESPFRSADLTPPTVADWGVINAGIRRENEELFAAALVESKKRMDAREPLFRVSEVEAALEEQRLRGIKYKKELREDEKQRWEMLNSMQERVITRPLLVEQFERPVHAASMPGLRAFEQAEARSVPNHTKPVAIESNIKNVIESKSFKDSAWGKEVATLRDRMDARPKLHEIHYGTFVQKEKPPPRRLHNEVDARIMAVMNQPAYKKSEWASAVAAIEQRQKDRVPLSEGG